jgi:hypothetical protein
LALPITPKNNTSDTDVKSDLTASSSQEIRKPVLLWLDADQELNIKGIEDFLCFPTGIHTPLYDKWFRRYALSKLLNATGILRWTDRMKLTILNFDQDSK